MRIDGPEEEEAVDAVRDVLRSKRLFRWSGVPGDDHPSRVDQFERAFAESMHTEHALAVNSGTSALVCALTGIGVGPGDEVIVPAFTWIATATSVLAVGAVPVVADIDDSLTLDPEDVQRKLSPYTKAIVPVHLRGRSAAMDQLMELARKNDLAVLEDTAQAVGATFHGRRLGTFGDAGIYSFQMGKIITAGEGGAVVTNNERIHRRALSYHDAGTIGYAEVSEEEWLPGLNLRMSELQAAVLLVQLARLDQLLVDMRARKKRLVGMIEGPLRAQDVGFPTIHDPEGEAAIAAILMLPDRELTGRVSEMLNRENVPAYPLHPSGPNAQVYSGWTPIREKRASSGSETPWDRHPRVIDYPSDACPRSTELVGRAVNVPISPDLSDQQVEQFAEAIVETVNKLN